MFGKVLSISDELMWRYYELLSTKSLNEIQELKLNVENGTIHPKAVKDNLAMEIVDRFHGNGEGIKAKDEFTKIFANKDIPTDIPEFTFSEGIWICQALVESNMTVSTSQARRDISAGGVKIDQEKLENDKLNLSKGEYIVQKGKKSFAKFIIG
jgi:tyrosyl-tRNA synthetase